MARCVFCDADFETGPGDILLVCPYCGTAQTAAGVTFKNHYMIRVHFNQTEAQATLLDWVAKQLGAPQDLTANTRFTSYQQIWYPFWISRVDADTTYSGMGRDANFYNEWPQYRGAYKRIEFFWKPESGRFTRRHEVKICGAEGVDVDIQNHPIPTRAKEYFSHAHAEEYNGTVLHSQIGEDLARKMAREQAIAKQTALIMQEVSKIDSRNDTIDVGETYLIHIPVWELEYKYGKSSYKASVAASTGYVIESKYPRSMTFRAMGMGFGLLLVLAGILSAALTTDYLPIRLFQFGGFVSGALLFVLGLALLYKGASRKEAKEKV
jgi:hypothetical protein